MTERMGPPPEDNSAPMFLCMSIEEMYHDKVFLIENSNSEKGITIFKYIKVPNLVPSVKVVLPRLSHNLEGDQDLSENQISVHDGLTDLIIQLPNSVQLKRLNDIREDIRTR